MVGAAKYLVEEEAKNQGLLLRIFRISLIKMAEKGGGVGNVGAGGFAAPQGYAPVPAADPAAAAGAAAAAAATAPAAAAMPEPPPSYDASQHQAQGEWIWNQPKDLR